MFETLRVPISFNRSLAQLGLGSVGIKANVDKDLRRDLIRACLQDKVSPQLVAAKIYFIYDRLGVISHSHRRIAEINLDLWTERKIIPDRVRIEEDIIEVLYDESKAKGWVDLVCRRAYIEGV